jgi:glyoxylase-like metal-dependent hydrolase (beta-lactamase superfamily II)
MQELPLKTAMTFAYGEPRELARGVARIVANNPGPLTFKGTNTYLIGTHRLAVLDPGPDEPAHVEAVLNAAGRRPISHIVLTHTHPDHIGALARLQAATGALTAGYGRRAGGGTRMSPGGGEYVDEDFVPDVPLADGDRLEGEDWTLLAVHTPGHAPDHLCFELAGSGILFTGDHVMGWNTSVVAPPEGNMGAYIRSLEKLTERTDEIYLPGHGGKVEWPQRLVKAYLMHRQMREQAVLDCIRQGKRNVQSIVPIVYKGLDERLMHAASLSVLAHVEHLLERGLVRCELPLTADRDLWAV